MSLGSDIMSLPLSTNNLALNVSDKIRRLDPNPLYRVFYRTPAKALIPPSRTLITLFEDTPIFEALKTLHENRILAAPVLAADGSCVGSIDVLSMLAYTGGENCTTPSQLWQNIKGLSVGEIAKVAIERKKLIPFFSENPVSMLIDLFGKGIHRVALFHKNKELIATISQSDVVRFLDKLIQNPEMSETPIDIQLLHNTMDKTAISYQLFKSVISIPSSQTMFEAMKTLATSQRQGLAIVDEDGVLHADISVSDLHDLPDANFTSLGMPVLHWLQAFSKSALTPPMVSNMHEITLKDLVHTFVTLKSHRMWCVDDQGKPTHVVSLTDILGFLGSGDVIDNRMASGDTDVSLLWRLTSPQQ